MATESIFRNIVIDDMQKAEAFITILEQSAKTADNLPLHLYVEDFIHNKAIKFARQRFAVTFLVFKKTERDSALVGYYTLTNKFVSTEGLLLVRTCRRKLQCFHSMMNL